MHDNPESSAYTVTLVSDTHYDEAPWDSYRPDSPADPGSLAWRNFDRNIKMWEALVPRLLSAAAERSEHSDFVMHLGDVAQGDATHSEALTVMLEKGYQRVAAAFGEKPVYLLVGNHDVRASSPTGRFMPQDTSFFT